MRDLGQLIVAKGFKKLPKVQKIAKSGHTVPNPYPWFRRSTAISGSSTACADSSASLSSSSASSSTWRYRNSGTFTAGSWRPTWSSSWSRPRCSSPCTTQNRKRPRAETEESLANFSCERRCKIFKRTFYKINWSSKFLDFWMAPWVSIFLGGGEGNLFLNVTNVNWSSPNWDPLRHSPGSFLGMRRRLKVKNRSKLSRDIQVNMETPEK